MGELLVPKLGEKRNGAQLVAGEHRCSFLKLICITYSGSVNRTMLASARSELPPRNASKKLQKLVMGSAFHEAKRSTSPPEGLVACERELLSEQQHTEAVRSPPRASVYGVPLQTCLSIDIERSRISGSEYYDLWLNNVTPLTNLQIRVEDTDLSTSLGGVAVAFDQQPTASTGSYVIDLGGGALGSRGRNCIFGAAIYDPETNGYNL